MGIQVSEGEGFPVLGLGTYQMVLTGIEERPSSNPDWDPQLVFKFQTVDEERSEDGEEVEPGLGVWAWLPSSWYAGNRTWRAVEALLQDSGLTPGDLPIVDGELDERPVLGRVATVKVDTYVSKKDGKTRNTVIKGGVLPANKSYRGKVFEEFVPDPSLLVDDGEGEDDEIPF